MQASDLYIGMVSIFNNSLFPPGFGGKAPCRGGGPHGDVTVVFVHVYVFSPCVFIEGCGYVFGYLRIVVFICFPMCIFQVFISLS